MANETTRIYELQVKLAQESLRNLQKLQSSADSVDKRMAKLSSSLKSFGLGAALAAGVNESVRAFSSLIDKMDEAGKAASKIGIPVEEFTSLSYAAKLANIETDAFTKSMTKLNVQLADVDTSTDAAGKMLRSFGVSGKDSPSEALLKISSAFTQMEDGAKRTAAAVTLFGKGGADMIPLLLEGATNIRAMTDEAERLGIVIGTDAAKAAQAYNDNLTKLNASANSLGISMANAMLPALVSVTDEMVKATKESGLLNGAWQGLKKTAEISFGTIGRDFAASVHTAAGDFNAMMAKRTTGDVSFNFTKTALAEYEAAKKIYGEIGKLADDQQKKASSRYGQNMKWQVDPKMTGEEGGKGKAGKKTDMELFIENTVKAQKEIDLIVPKLEQLDKLFFSGKIDAGVYDKQKEALLGVGKAAETVLTPMQELEASLVAQQADWNLQAEKLKLVDELYIAGAINLKIYEDALKSLGVANVENTKKTEEQLSGMDKMMSELGSKIDGYSSSIAGTLVDFATNSDDAAGSFSDFANSVLRDLAKMATQILIVEPLMQSLKLAMAASGGIGGLLGSLFGFADGDVVRSPSLSKYSNGIYDSPQVFAFAKGGMPSAGVFAEAGPEAIMPLSRGPDGTLGVDASGSGGSGDVIVNVFNESKAEVQTQTKTDQNGNRVIELMIKDAVSRGFSSGAFDAIMGTTFGLNRRGAM